MADDDSEVVDLNELRPVMESIERLFQVMHDYDLGMVQVWKSGDRMEFQIRGGAVVNVKTKNVRF